jgi:type IV pilus assembly protein PilE
MSKSVQGFTLIELIIAIIIIGILAAMVYPSYISQVRKTRRADAKIALTELAGLQESYFVENNGYAASFKDLLGIESGEKYGFKLKGDGKLLSKDRYYQITIRNFESGTGTGFETSFVLEAKPVDEKAQADDTLCPTFRIFSTGKKTAPDGENCW